MRLAGVGDRLGIDIFKLAGVASDADDLPWWAAEIAIWLAMVKTIQEASGPAGTAARAKLEIALGAQRIPGYPHGPAALYAIYEEFLVMARSAAAEG